MRRRHQIGDEFPKEVRTTCINHDPSAFTTEIIFSRAELADDLKTEMSLTYETAIIILKYTGIVILK